MKNKAEKDTIKKILYAVLVCALLFLMKNSYDLAKDVGFYEYINRSYDLNQLDIFFRHADYPELIKAVKVNEVIGREDKESEEISALANIYNYAVFYHGYESLDSEKAQVYAEKIEAYKAKLSHRIFLDEYKKLKQEFDLP